MSDGGGVGYNLYLIQVIVYMYMPFQLMPLMSDGGGVVIAHMHMHLSADARWVMEVGLVITCTL